MSASGATLTGTDADTTDSRGIRGGTDGTAIGNTGDRLKVDAGSIPVTVGPDTSTGILKQGLATVSAKTEQDLSGSSYTVPSSKTFKLTSITASYDTQTTMIIRLKKQTGGAGLYATLFQFVLAANGQDVQSFTIAVPVGVNIGVATDVFKVTYESSLSKGVVWAGYTGIEF